MHFSLNFSYVEGFISRAEAEKLVASQGDEGSFVVRFSDSEAGGVSIPFSCELPNGTFAAASLGPLTKEDLTRRDIRQTIDEVTVKYGTRVFLLKSVCYKEMTGEGGMELVKTKDKVQAFPPSVLNGQAYNNPKPKWGYVKIASVPVGVHDDPPVQNYLGSPTGQVSVLSQTIKSAFPQEQLRGTGAIMYTGEHPVYETYANNHVDITNPEAAADMELEMVD